MSESVRNEDVREVYLAKLRQRLADKTKEPIFEVKEVSRDSQPFLIQCCIR